VRQLEIALHIGEVTLGAQILLVLALLMPLTRLLTAETKEANDKCEAEEWSELSMRRSQTFEVESVATSAQQQSKPLLSAVAA